MTHKDCHVLV